MNKTVLVLGGSGLLGKEVVRAFTTAGWAIIAPTHSELDLTDTAAVELYVEAHETDVVVHTAGSINVDAIEEDPLSAWQVNALSAGAVARVLARLGRTQTKFFYLSSNYVFGDAQTEYYEDDDAAPMNAYGASKVLGELLVHTYAVPAGIPFSIIRTSWLYSEFRPTFVDAVATALGKGEVFKASDEYRGNPTSAKDLAEALVVLAIGDATLPSILHLVNGGEGVSRYDIAQVVAKALGADESLVEQSTDIAVWTAPRPRTAVLVPSEALPLPEWKVSLTTHIQAHTKS